MAINCAAIPETLLESELFGHEKGSFTGAVKSSKGLFVQAGGGTMFLDEIGDMSLAIQAKLLRVIQERQFFTVGGEQSVDVDVRIIVATNKNIEELVKQGCSGRICTTGSMSYRSLCPPCGNGKRTFLCWRSIS